MVELNFRVIPITFIIIYLSNKVSSFTLVEIQINKNAIFFAKQTGVNNAAIF